MSPWPSTQLRAHIDERAAARGDHIRDHGLGAKELVFQVLSKALVPVFRRDVLDGAAVVARG
jgi:hypothetical protein